MQGRDGPANHGRLCVKGRFGFDYAHHPHRLTQPLVCRADVPKDVNVLHDPADWAQVFRPATWDEALDLAAGQFKTLRDGHGAKALAGFGSAKGSNEEAYLFQKLVRTGFGSNNVDHCTRLCHASSVAALLMALCLVCGQIGKPGSGRHPLRGQNNVQGASDAGLLPMMFPNYQPVDDPAVHAWFEQFWGMSLDAQPGYTVVEILDKALSPASGPHKVRGMFIQGENPAMSDPDLNHARAALASLSHLVVQDIFMTETAWQHDAPLGRVGCAGAGRHRQCQCA